MTTNLKALKSKLTDARKELDAIDKTRWALTQKIKKLEFKIAERTYTCPCVRLNSDIGITNMVQQETAGRKGLQFGLVAETFSAKKNCPHCKGSGKLPEEEEHVDTVP